MITKYVVSWIGIWNRKSTLGKKKNEIQIKHGVWLTIAEQCLLIHCDKYTLVM